MGLLGVRLLGGFALTIDGEPVSPPKSRKAQALVAYLALRRGRAINREEVAEALWPDKELHAARFNLRQCLGVLRKECPSLSGFLVAEGRTLISLAPDTSVDVERFRNSHAAEAVALYKGDLLPGLDDEWLEPIRAELKERAIGAVAQAADQCDADIAVELLRKALAMDPYRESLVRRLIVKLAAGGDLTGAEEAMRSFRLLLHQEMRVEPSPETEAEYRRLMQSARPGQPPPSHRLPAPVNKILGRKNEIRDVRARLKNERLITLLGPGGAGKTRLAVAVGTEELPLWKDGVWFVDFSSVQDEGLVVQAVAETLQIGKRANESWDDLLLERLRTKALLLIFDNCEHLIEACARRAALVITKAPNVSILATSRTPFEVNAERRMAVEPLELPETLPDEGTYLSFPALELFEDRARKVSPGFAIRSSNVAQVISICRELDGLPLGIEMAAARLGSFAIDSIKERMDQKLTFLQSPERGAPARQRNLSAVIEWSYELLSPEGRVLLRRLPIFAAGCTLDAATFVCGFEPIAEESFPEAIDELMDASLLRLDGDRYRLFETVKQFASGAAHDPDLLGRLVDYYERFCHRAQAEGWIRGPDVIADRFRPELDNLRAALQSCIDGGHAELGLRLALSSADVFTALHLDGEMTAYLQSLLAVDLGSSLRIPALAQASSVYQSLDSDLERVHARELTVEVCGELRRLAKAAGNVEALAQAYLSLGRVWLWWQPDRAKAALEKAAALPSPRIRPHVLRLLGQHAYDAKDLGLAQSLMVEAQELAQQLGDTRQLISSLEAEAHLLRETGRSDEALQKLMEVEWICLQWADARSQAFNQLRLAELFLDRWEFDAMRKPLEMARAFFGTSKKRLHGMLIDGMLRYLAAHDGDERTVCDGIYDVTAELVRTAKLHPSSYWHGACIELEALALLLAQRGEREEASKMFAGAQSLRQRDWAFLSPGVLERWKRFKQGTELHETGPPTDNDPDLLLMHVGRIERRIMASSVPIDYRDG